MLDVDTAIGSSALLRVSGCPIRLWMAAGNPEMFQMLRQINQQQECYSTLGKTLAELLGRDLVPQARLSGRERALVLEVRRQLFNSIPIREQDCQQLINTADHFLGSPNLLSRELERAELCARGLIVLEAQAIKRIEQEHVRVYQAAWELVQSTFVAGTMLRNVNLPIYQEIEKRLSRSEPWASRRLRQRSDYLWRMITRATAKSTPRGWCGHVALLPIAEEAQASDLITVTTEFTTEWMQNVHLQRHVLWQSALEQEDQEMRLTISPLHWFDTHYVRFWVVDPTDPTRMTEVSLRRTNLLEAICNTLRSGPGTFSELEDKILATPDLQQRKLLKKFVEHLAGLGVLQVSLPPRSHLEHLWPPIVKMNEGGESEDDKGYLDVYRNINETLPLANCLHLQELTSQVLRVLSLITADQLTESVKSLDGVDQRARPVLDILRDLLGGGEKLYASRRNPSAWPTPVNKHSGYASLLAWMKERADDSAPLDLSPTLLDELNAKDEEIDWPLDCLLRVPCKGADFSAVLDQVVPAGILDARFVTTLHQLHGQVSNVTSYRDFLDHLEKEIGITFVEVLIPPLSDRAANAVRRPVYTRAWTGDPDLQMYYPQNCEALEYIPLDTITLRRSDYGLLAEADGRPIWPIYHATRIPLQPWNLLADLLLAASPRSLRWTPWCLYNTLDVFPLRSFMPRITVGKELVVSCAQWRIATDQLWDPSSSELVKARRLEQLRHEFNLPRWIFVINPHSGKPIPCDLESLRTIRTLERLYQDGNSSIIMVEMLPTPDQLLVRDLAHQSNDRLVSELLLRLPCDELPMDMATRIARLLRDRRNSILYHSPPAPEEEKLDRGSYPSPRKAVSAAAPTDAPGAILPNPPNQTRR